MDHLDAALRGGRPLCRVKPSFAPQIPVLRGSKPGAAAQSRVSCAPSISSECALADAHAPMLSDPAGSVVGDMSATLLARGLAAGHGDRTLFSGLDLVVAPGDVV